MDRSTGNRPVPATEVWVGAGQFHDGDRDRALTVMRCAVDELIRTRRIGYCVAAAATFAEALLDSASDEETNEAQRLIERLNALQDEHDPAMLRITLLRLRAHLSLVRGERDAYLDLVQRYRAMAADLGFEGHIDWAEELTAAGQAPRSTSTVSSRRA